MRSSRSELTRGISGGELGPFLSSFSARYVVHFMPIWLLHAHKTQYGTFLCSIFQYFCAHNCIFTPLKTHCRLSPWTKIPFQVGGESTERNGGLGVGGWWVGWGLHALLVVKETFRISHMSPPPGHSQGTTKVLPKENYSWTKKKTYCSHRRDYIFIFVQKNVIVNVLIRMI